MADKIEETIREIAAKHGIAVGRDDPILILQTLNEMLLRDTALAQQNILDQFKEELEAIAFRWGEDARNKAERTLNAALQASRQTLHEATQEAVKTACDSVKMDLSSQAIGLTQQMRQNQVIAWLNLAGAVLAIAAASIMLLN